MNKKQHSLTLVLALIAGLVGGVVSSQFLNNRPAFAEKKPKPQKVAEVEELRVVDREGNLLARIGQVATDHYFHDVSMEMFDNKGKRRVHIGIKRPKSTPVIQGSSMALYNTEGKVVAALGEAIGRGSLILTGEEPFLSVASTSSKGGVVLSDTNIYIVDKKGDDTLWEAP